MRLRILRRGRQRRVRGGRLELREDVRKVVAGELPRERTGNRLVAVLKEKQSLGNLAQFTTVVEREHLPLDDREVDLDLVEPACVDGQMDPDEFGVMPVTALQTTGWRAARDGTTRCRR